ncbi:Jag N-terminal domain-containing protein, partial [Paenibacillus xylanexedens]|uniref:Jag N-terminal domain-containing protein n=1 Tax=Paenibacillus xylanexedens TaxID=528191 RepID=UPI0021B2E28C
MEMRKVIRSGKRVEDGVKEGLREVGVSGEKVEIEVLEEGSKGLLGLMGVKAGKVEVKVLGVGEVVEEGMKGGAEV